MNTGNQPTRVKFQERKLLRARDLSDEQAYHLEMRRRHNLALHSWGIAYGLQLVVEENASSPSITVQPGVAIDGFGRELVVAQKLRIPDVDHKVDKGPFDVWLYYGLQRAERDNRSDVNKLLIEIPSVKKESTAARRSPKPREPAQVLREDLTFSPERPPPDDPDQQWPVFLGKIEFKRDETDPASEERWRVDPSDRPYAGLIAERIVSASRPLPNLDTTDADRVPVGPASKQTTIQNGGEPGRASYPFAVYVHDEGKLDEANPSFAVRDTGDLEINAERVDLSGNLVLLSGSSLEFQSNPVAGVPQPSVAGPGQPWRIYHHFRPGKPTSQGGDAAPSAVAADDDGYSDELRISMAGTPANTNRVAIGHWSDKGKFSPVLTIEDNGNVTIDGSLIVKGLLNARLADAPITPPATPASAPPQTIPERVKDLLNNDEIRREFFKQINEGPNQTIRQKFIEGLSGIVVENAEGAQKQLQPLVEAVIGTPTSASSRGVGVVATLFESDSGREALARCLMKDSTDNNGRLAKWINFIKGPAAQEWQDFREQLAKRINDAVPPKVETMIGYAIADSNREAFVKEFVSREAFIKEFVKSVYKDNPDGPEKTFIKEWIKSLPADGEILQKRLQAHFHQLLNELKTATEPKDAAACVAAIFFDLAAVGDNNQGMHAVASCLLKGLPPVAGTPPTAGAPPVENSRLVKFANIVNKPPFQALESGLKLIFSLQNPPQPAPSPAPPPAPPAPPPPPI